MLHDVQSALDYAEKSEKILQKDIEYLAQKYVNSETDIELPMIEEDISIPEVSFQSLLQRLVHRIDELKPGVFIDVLLLHGYVDYYLELLDHFKSVS